ncbi:MAG: hypothetical protein ACR2II_11535 [Chthoniobacterales bacterium]
MPDEHIPQRSRRNFIAFFLVVGLIAAALLGWQLLRSRSASSPTDASAKLIAMLPFANLNSERENEDFVSGMQDIILTKLAESNAYSTIAISPSPAANWNGPSRSARILPTHIAGSIGIWRGWNAISTVAAPNWRKRASSIRSTPDRPCLDASSTSRVENMSPQFNSPSA